MGGDEDPAKAGARRLMGTFDAPTYISIGDDYTKKIKPDPRYRSKQFQTSPGKRGIAGARDQTTLFEPQFLMLYKNEKYTMQNYYNVDLSGVKDGGAPVRKENKKGFVSSDNAKRDEFSNSVRTAQWREGLKKEHRFTQKASASFYKNMPSPQKEDPRMKMMMRRMMKSSSVYGSHTFGPDGKATLPPLAAKTSFARRPIVRNSFYRRTGVFTS